LVKAAERPVTPAELLDEAEQAEAAFELLPELPAGASSRANAVIALLADRALDQASPRAVWNLLWLAGELSIHVDVYRAEALLRAVASFYARRLRPAPPELADCARMAFAFFFEREDPPLLVFRKEQCEALLQNLNVTPSRP
jgi:hypothetical protein